MKHYLLAGLLLAAVPTLAQIVPPVGQEAAQPFKKANIILVHTPDSAKAALKRTAMILQQRGYAIDRLDYELLSISTKPKAYSGSVYSLTILIVWDGDKLKFSGQWKGQAMGMTVEEQAAMTNPASKKAFAEMQAVAGAYPGGQVAYKQQL